MRCLSCPGDLDQRLYDALRAWRLDTARDQRVPAFCIFTDATLTAIAENRPTSEQALGDIPGIGRAKLQRYGTDLLAVCAAVNPGSAATR